MLVMTATPIPRTLALTLYGDLETSVMDELPPGRTPIKTRRVTEMRADEVWEFVRKQVEAGRQAYVVYPVIEEGAMEGELKAAIKMYEQLRKHELAGLRVGLLHGRMSADEKDATMASFQAGRDRCAGGDNGDRGWSGRSERERDGDGARGAVWPFADASVARAHRTRHGASRFAC